MGCEMGSVLHFSVRAGAVAGQVPMGGVLLPARAFPSTNHFV